MTTPTRPSERRRFAKFAVVGASGAVVDFGVFNALSLLTGVTPVVASMLSFGCAVVTNYMFNRLWTFPDSRSKRKRVQLTQYAVVSVVGLLIRTPIFQVASGWLLGAMGSRWLLGLAPETLAHNLALATAIGVVMLWNFFANRYWTFGDVR